MSVWLAPSTGAHGQDASSPKARVRRSPRTTTTEAVGRGTGNTKAIHRSTITGQFVTRAIAQRRPDTTIRQEV